MPKHPQNQNFTSRNRIRISLSKLAMYSAPKLVFDLFICSIVCGNIEFVEFGYFLNHRTSLPVVKAVDAHIYKHSEYVTVVSAYLAMAVNIYEFLSRCPRTVQIRACGWPALSFRCPPFYSVSYCFLASPNAIYIS